MVESRLVWVVNKTSHYDFTTRVIEVVLDGVHKYKNIKSEQCYFHNLPDVIRNWLISLRTQHLILPRATNSFFFQQIRICGVCPDQIYAVVIERNDYAYLNIAFKDDKNKSYLFHIWSKINFTCWILKSQFRSY
jgi:hypothetical protein